MFLRLKFFAISSQQAYYFVINKEKSRAFKTQKEDYVLEIDKKKFKKSKET